MADGDKASPTGKTGIFYVREPAGVVVQWQGEVVERYATVAELVETHIKGIAALERELARLLEDQYR
jgi:hypothetical protein